MTTMDGISIHDTRSCDCSICDGRRKQLWSHAENFVQDQEIRAPESIHQCDRIIENAYAFIEGCADLVGYFED